MNRRRIAGVIAAATVVALSQASMVWAAPSVPALTAGQKATVYRALISRGDSAPVARKVSEDPSMARAVGVSSGSSEAHGGATLPQGTVLPMSVGSSCSGSSGWVSRSQWINNVYGGRIMSASLVTNFCYNGSSVTYAWSSKSESVTSLGSWGGWYFSSWAEFAEGWLLLQQPKQRRGVHRRPGRLPAMHHPNRMSRERPADHAYLRPL
jgi:hypothetical protein